MPPRPGKTTCELCAEVSKKHHKISYGEAKAKQLCTECETNTPESGLRCNACIKHRDDWLKARLASMRCRYCPKERVKHRQTCEECRLKKNIESGKRRGYSVSKWKKRGRRFLTDGNKVVSHEEVVRGSMKRAALQCATSGMCACGMPIPKASRGKMVRCGACSHKLRTEKSRAYHRAHRATTKAEYGPRVLDDLEAAKRDRAGKDRAAARMREWRTQRKALGLCVQCKAKAMDGRPVCEKHAATSRKATS